MGRDDPWRHLRAGPEQGARGWTEQDPGRPGRRQLSRSLVWAAPTAAVATVGAADPPDRPRKDDRVHADPRASRIAIRAGARTGPARRRVGTAARRPAAGLAFVAPTGAIVAGAVPRAARDPRLHVVHGLAAARLAEVHRPEELPPARLGRPVPRRDQVHAGLHGDHHGRAVRGRVRPGGHLQQPAPGHALLPHRVLPAVRRRHRGRLLDVVGQLQRPARRLQPGCCTRPG